MKTLSYEEYQEKVSKLKDVWDVTQFAKDLIAPTLQAMLNGELDNFLGYPKNHPSGDLTGNSRNGYSKKKLKWSFWETEINIPRDRKWDYEPIAVKKYESMEAGLEEKVISMYAKGMTTSDINSHLHEIYWVNISSSMVSTITDQVMHLVKEWQERPLSSLYPIVYLDWIHFKVRDSGKIVNKCAYIALWINTDGIKEIIWIWVWENEGAKFWLQVLNNMKMRWVNNILITCIDWLKGFPEAISSVFPETQIQKCIIHQIRNTTKYIPYKDKKKFCSDLKLVYTALTEESALEELKIMKAKWEKYAVYLESWERNWTELSTFFQYPAVIRKIIYTTNAIESLNRQFRKVTKTTSIFPHNDALKKLLWLSQRDITKKWNHPIPNWGEIIAQFSIIFPEKIKI